MRSSHVQQTNSRENTDETASRRDSEGCAFVFEEWFHRVDDRPIVTFRSILNRDNFSSLSKGSIRQSNH